MERHTPLLSKGPRSTSESGWSSQTFAAGLHGQRSWRRLVRANLGVWWLKGRRGRAQEKAGFFLFALVAATSPPSRTETHAVCGEERRSQNLVHSTALPGWAVGSVQKLPPSRSAPTQRPQGPRSHAGGPLRSPRNRCRTLPRPRTVAMGYG